MGITRYFKDFYGASACISKRGGSIMSRFEPRKRTIDGEVWWCIYDAEKGDYFGKWKQKKYAELWIADIDGTMPQLLRHI